MGSDGCRALDVTACHDLGDDELVDDRRSDCPAPMGVDLSLIHGRSACSSPHYNVRHCVVSIDVLSDED